VIDKSLNGLLIQPLIDLVKEYLPNFKFRTHDIFSGIRILTIGPWSKLTNKLTLQCSCDTLTIVLAKSSHFFPHGELVLDFRHLKKMIENDGDYGPMLYEFTLFKVTCTTGSGKKYNIPILDWESKCSYLSGHAPDCHTLQGGCSERDDLYRW
jgi:hypothetical protein